MKILLMTVLFFVISTAVCRAQINFEVPKGKAVNGFTFSDDGVLKYKGKDFAPPVKVSEQYEKFEISFLPGSGMTGAIANDGGENILFLLDTKKAISKEIEQLSTPKRMFWSPSRKFLVVYGEWEDAGLYSIDVATGKVRQNGNWFPGHDLWVLVNDPKWVGKSNLLVFKVTVGCDPTADPSNPCQDVGDPIIYEVRVDAATMRLRNKKRIRRLN